MNYRSLTRLAVSFIVVLIFCESVQAAMIYVSPKGNDANNGSEARPLATVQKALSLAEAHLGQKEPVTIFLADGRYFVDEVISLDSRHSGKLLISAVNPGKAVLDGGVYPEASDFKVVSDRAVLKRIQPNAQKHIRVLDLKKYNFTNTKAFPLTFSGQRIPPLFEIYFKGERMDLSRYPKEGWMRIKEVVNNGGGAHPGSNKLKDSVCLFEYRDRRTAKWLGAVEQGLWLMGYWRVEWQIDAIRVKNIDPQAGTVELASVPGGGLGTKYIRPQGSGLEPYCAINLLEEISTPGQWCIDFASQKLYFWPPETIGKGDVIICDRNDPLVKINGAKNIQLQGIAFQYNRGSGVIIDNCVNVELAGCKFREIDAAAVTITGGMKCGVRSCDMFNLGSSGIILQNVPRNQREISKADMRPRGHYVINNHIHDFAILQRIYAPAVHVGFEASLAVGMHVANNLIHDTPHGGILYGSHRNVIEYNEIFRMCQESGDLGGIYSADMKRRKIGKSGFGNNIIRYNFEHHGVKSRGIYIDFEQNHDKIYSNINYGLGLGYLIKKGDGTPHYVVNNMAINNGHDFNVAQIEGNVYKNNLSVNSGAGSKDLIGAKMEVLDQGKDGGAVLRLNGDPGFMDPENMDFRLKKDSPVFKERPGLKQIPMHKIGLYVDEYRTTLPPETKLTLSDFVVHPTELSIGKVSSSSENPSFKAEKAFDANPHTSWQPAGDTPDWRKQNWLMVDFGKIRPVKVSQVRFGLPERFTYCYTIETSKDGKSWQMYADYSKGQTSETGKSYFETRKNTAARFMRLNLLEPKTRQGERAKFWGGAGVCMWNIE